MDFVRTRFEKTLPKAMPTVNIFTLLIKKCISFELFANACIMFLPDAPNSAKRLMLFGNS